MLGGAGRVSSAAAGGHEAVRPPIAEELGSLLRTGACLFVLPLALVIASAAAIVLALLRAPPPWIDRLYTAFTRLCVRMAGTRIEVHGEDHLVPGQAYVVVPNHESDWDPVVLMAALPSLRLRAVLKEQIARLAIVGRALLLTGNVRVERRDTVGDVRRIQEGMAARRREVSMLFYAEGTRSRDGGFHEFKKGAFATAIAYGMPVLPVGTAGTRRIWRPNSIRIRSGPVVIMIGEPLAVAGLRPEDRDALRDRAHVAVRALRAEARRRLRALGVEPGGID